MSLMGVGTNILGYCNNEVDNAVKKALRDSGFSFSKEIEKHNDFLTNETVYTQRGENDL